LLIPFTALDLPAAITPFGFVLERQSPTCKANRALLHTWAKQNCTVSAVFILESKFRKRVRPCCNALLLRKPRMYSFVYPRAGAGDRRLWHLGGGPNIPRFMQASIQKKSPPMILVAQFATGLHRRRAAWPSGGTTGGPISRSCICSSI